MLYMQMQASKLGAVFEGVLIICNAQVCGYFGWTECEYGSKCSCAMDLLGIFCLSWGCQTSAAQ
jgi:hypothetical protein